MATNDDQMETGNPPPIRKAAGPAAWPGSGASAVKDGAVKGARIGAVVVGVTGAIIGLGIGIMFAVARGRITDWAVIAAFGMIVTAMAGGIYGALAGAVSGGVVGAIVRVVKSGRR
jgi:hypothetical protein